MGLRLEHNREGPSNTSLRIVVKAGLSRRLSREHGAKSASNLRRRAALEAARQRPCSCQTPPPERLGDGCADPNVLARSLHAGALVDAIELRRLVLTDYHELV